MSLTSLQWRKLPDRYIPAFAGTATSSYVLDTIYDMLTGSVYHDGTTRTQGVGSAWQQVTKFVTGSNTEAVYCFPPTKTIMSQSVIFAAKNVVGASSSANPETVTNEVLYNTDVILGTVVKGAVSESFTQWTSLFPFGSGSVSSKYASWFRLSHVSSGSYSPKITIYESKEALAGVVYEPIFGSSYIILLGAIIDPEQNVTATDAELDGRLYSVATSGIMAPIAPNLQGFGYMGLRQFWVRVDTGLMPSFGFLKHQQNVNDTSYCYPRFVTLTPQTGSLLPTEVMKFADSGSGIVQVEGKGSNGTYNCTHYFTTRSGRYVRRPIFCVATGSYVFLGRLRDMSQATGTPSGTVVKDTSNNIVGFAVGSSENSASATLLLNYS